VKFFFTCASCEMLSSVLFIVLLYPLIQFLTINIFVRVTVDESHCKVNESTFSNFHVIIYEKTDTEKQIVAFLQLSFLIRQNP
jgi:hypothetical protein